MVRWSLSALKSTPNASHPTPQPQRPLSQHNAPPVVYPLGRSRLQGQLLLSIWLMVAIAVGVWIANSQLFGGRQALGLALLTVSGAAAWTGWKNSAVGQLSWDGQDWHWQSNGYQAGAVDHNVSIAFDFQSLMLLRVDNRAHAKLWLWAERSAFPERWLDLRRAVYSPRRTLNHNVSPV